VETLIQRGIADVVRAGDPVVFADSWHLEAAVQGIADADHAWGRRGANIGDYRMHAARDRIAGIERRPTLFKPRITEFHERSETP
jgi:hypothetical protein